MAVACFGIGTIAQPVFGLGFVDSVLAILFFNILGVLPTSFFSTFGPVFGLRQLVLSRFYFGWYGVKLCKCPNLPPPDLSFSPAGGIGAKERCVAGSGVFFNVLTCHSWCPLPSFIIRE
jgi:hypothetical protein